MCATTSIYVSHTDGGGVVFFPFLLGNVASSEERLRKDAEPLFFFPPFFSPGNVASSEEGLRKITDNNGGQVFFIFLFFLFR